MKKILTICLVLSVVAFSACDELDPTRDIKNPNLLLKNIIGKAGSTTSWLVGQERQLAIVHNNLIDLTEIGSDNYANVQTFFNQQFDGLSINFQDPDINTLQFSIADLRESAEIGLNLIHPNDPSATDAQRADLFFFSGYAKLLAGEYFVALPLDSAAAPSTSRENLMAALNDFLAAERLNANHVGYKLALARTYRSLGNRTNAVTKASEALALSTNYTRTVDFDNANGPTNTMANALFDRGTFDDLQPLPRLDFLDPKYFTVNSQERSIYYQKAEEAYLIRAESEIADNDLAGARAELQSLLTLVNSRATISLNDKVENRRNRDRSARPSTADVKVRASATDSLRSNLVVNRQTGNVQVSVISGTSVSSAIINSSTTVEQLLELTYLMRQEIFLAEGRRFVDLGIKMPVSQVEQQVNKNVTDAHTKAFVPSFVPKNMDAFTFDEATKQVVITVNMNKVLVTNRANDAVVPFF